MASIERLGFGSTGHESSRLIFGAAALAGIDQTRSDAVLEELLAAGVNHIDCAARYGEAELRVGPWMGEHRDRFFVASKTGERSYEAARDQIAATLERMQLDVLDLIQLHNLVDEEGWEQAFGDDGALRAAVEARDAGQVRFIGVTGHGTRVAAMHLRSLERFAFDSVLLPYNFAMMQQPEYEKEFEQLLAVCRERGVAVQTIKSIARRRWEPDERPTTTTWYKPLEEPADIERAVHWALSRPGIFVNSASDPTLLTQQIAAAQSVRQAPSHAAMETAADDLAIRPLFIRGYGEGVGRAPA